MRYVAVGAFNTAASYGIYCLFVYLGTGYALAALIATAAGVVISFVTMGRLVFMSRLRGRFVRFAGTWVVLYLINVGIIRLLVDAGLDPYAAGLLAAVPVVAASFLAQRFWVFR